MDNYDAIKKQLQKRDSYEEALEKAINPKLFRVPNRDASKVLNSNYAQLVFTPGEDSGMKPPKDATEDYEMQDNNTKGVAEEIMDFMVQQSQAKQDLDRVKHQELMETMAQIHRGNTAPQDDQRVEEMRQYLAAERGKLAAQFEEVKRAYAEQSSRLVEQGKMMERLRAEAVEHQRNHAQTVEELRTQNQQNSAASQARYEQTNAELQRTKAAFEAHQATSRREIEEREKAYELLRRQLEESRNAVAATVKEELPPPPPPQPPPPPPQPRRGKARPRAFERQCEEKGEG
jgi:hypothetical protein